MQNKMLDWISVVMALLLAVVIYTIIAKKTKMWPFDGFPHIPIGPGPVIPPPSPPVVPPPSPAPVVPPSPANVLRAMLISQDNKKKGAILFASIFALLLVAMILSGMIRRKSVPSMGYRFCGGM